VTFFFYYTLIGRLKKEGKKQKR